MKSNITLFILSTILLISSCMTSNSRVEKIEYDEIIFSGLQHGMDSTEIFKIIGKPDSLKLLVDVVGDSSILLCYKNMEATLLNKKLYF